MIREYCLPKHILRPICRPAVWELFTCCGGKSASYNQQPCSRHIISYSLSHPCTLPEADLPQAASKGKEIYPASTTLPSLLSEEQGLIVAQTGLSKVLVFQEAPCSMSAV